MTTATIRRHRNHAFLTQHGRCIYCGCPMWTGDPKPYAKKFGITLADAELFQCTAEHKLARKDGGTDTRSNIVAACWQCNHDRHATDPHHAMDFLTYSIYVAWNRAAELPPVGAESLGRRVDL